MVDEIDIDSNSDLVLAAADGNKTYDKQISLWVEVTYIGVTILLSSPSLRLLFDIAFLLFIFRSSW